MGKKESQAKWYQANKARHKANVAVIKAAQVKRNQELIIAYLLEHPCVDCEESDIVVLQFDHVRGEKRNDLSRLLTLSSKVVKTEIEKCEVRCANCHQRRTAERKQSYRVLWVAGVSGNIPPS